MGIFDTFQELKSNLQLRRHWIADFVFVHAINKKLNYTNDDVVTIAELSKILRSPKYGLGPQILSDRSNNTGVFLQKTKKKNPLNDSPSKSYTFLYIANEDENPFDDRQYKWKTKINTKSFTLIANIRKNKDIRKKKDNSKAQKLDLALTILELGKKPVISPKLPEVYSNPWYSPEYELLFDRLPDEDNIGDSLVFMLDSLQQGLNMNLEHIVAGYVSEKKTPLSTVARTRVHQKCMYLTCALQKR